jgi:Ca-activated chloride channel family protein
MAALAERYRRSRRGIDGRCVDIKVSIGSSRRVADALALGPTVPWDTAADGARPDVWSPSSTIWTERLRSQTGGKPNQVGLDGSLVSVTRTPIVIAMPQPMAEALGWPGKKLGWQDLVPLAADPAGWGSKGHPDWGRFTLGKTNPNTSTTGLSAMISTITSLLGGAQLTEQALQAPRMVEDARILETAAVHYGSSVSTFIQNLYDADGHGQGLHYVSAIALEEQVIYQYNRGVLVGTDGVKPKPPSWPTSTNRRRRRPSWTRDSGTRTTGPGRSPRTRGWWPTPATPGSRLPAPP